MELKPPELGTIEELASSDPLWRKVLDQEATTPQIKFFSFMGRMTDAQAFVSDTLALHAANSEKLVAHKMRDVPSLLMKHQLLQNPDGSPFKPTLEIFEYLTKNLKNATREKVEQHYPRWVLNQCLVTYCTILDSFLDSTLDAVFQHNPKILYGLAEAKNIDLKKLVELGTVDAVIKEIRAKEIRNFSSGDIAVRLDYFKRKLRIDTSNLFDWELTDKDEDRRLEGLNLESLEKYYQQRHDIVHRDDTPISNYDELDKIALFFLNMASRLAMAIYEKHGITWDLFLMATRNVSYNALKAASDPTHS